MHENAGGSTDDDLPSLAESIGDMMGDFVESPELITDREGAPPDADPGETPDPAAEGSEGEDDAEHAGAPPADAADPDPDALDPADDDLLADAKPLPYTVAGQERTFDGITYLGPDKGGFITPDKLAAVQQRLSERDHLHETKLRQSEEYKALERQTSWQTTDAQGNVKVLTGAPALEAQRVVTARSLAMNQAVAPLLAGDVDPASLIVWDEQGQRLVWDAQALEGFKAKMSFEVDKAAWNASRHFERLGAPAPVVETPTNPADAAAPTIAELSQAHNVQGLTPEDRAFLAEQFPHYLTPDQKAVKPAFLDLMKRTAAANSTRAQAVTAAADISTKNAARLAAAARGVKPNAQPAVRPKPDISPTYNRAQDAEDAFDREEAAAAAALRRRTGSY